MYLSIFVSECQKTFLDRESKANQRRFRDIPMYLFSLFMFQEKGDQKILRCLSLHLHNMPTYNSSVNEVFSSV